MEAAVAAELQRLTEVDEPAGYEQEIASDEEDEAANSGLSDSDVDNDDNGASGSAASDDEEDDTGMPLTDVSEAPGTSGDADQPAFSGRLSTQDGTNLKKPNARDLKATGVARAAARLLDQDDPDGGLAILSKSKSVAKRQREDAEESKAVKAAKKMRLEMRQRGHVAVPKRGEDPEHDAQEKTLLKTATRGVVRLFNAVSKAQRDQKDAMAGGSRSRVAKLDKASFLAELRGIGANKGKATALPAGTGPAAGTPSQQPQQQEGGSGWGVLTNTFGLQGGDKMKDWDKQDDSDEELPNEGLQDVTDSDSDGGGW
ncbi:hypothetical protein WJX79_009718 [Trebouxia sp. C0005]|nr:MAG: RRP15 -like [Trebouxia sp. A1-2]